jgi:hypothetical protein
MTTLRHIARFMGKLCRHKGIPKWLRIGLVILLLIPGPVDELIAAAVLVPLAVWRREIIAECWAASR